MRQLIFLLIIGLLSGCAKSQPGQKEAETSPLYKEDVTSFTLISPISISEDSKEISSRITIVPATSRFWSIVSYRLEKPSSNPITFQVEATSDSKACELEHKGVQVCNVVEAANESCIPWVPGKAYTPKFSELQHYPLTLLMVELRNWKSCIVDGVYARQSLNLSVIATASQH